MHEDFHKHLGPRWAWMLLKAWRDYQEGEFLLLLAKGQGSALLIQTNGLTPGRAVPDTTDMKRYPVTLVETDEGFAVWCDALPGCCSQGKTRDEALRNIRDAIGEYQAAQADIETRSGVRLEHAAVTV